MSLKKYCSVILEVNGREEERKLNMYNDLLSFKSIINTNIDSNIVWESKCKINESKYVSRAYIEQEGLNYLNRMHWPELFRFMAKNMFDFQKATEDVLEILIVKYGR